MAVSSLLMWTLCKATIPTSEGFTEKGPTLGTRSKPSLLKTHKKQAPWQLIKRTKFLLAIICTCMQIKTPLKKRKLHINLRDEIHVYVVFLVESHKSWEPSLMNPLRRPSANGNGHNWMYIYNNNEMKAKKLRCCSISN